MNGKICDSKIAVIPIPKAVEEISFI